MAARLWFLGFLVVGTQAFICDRVPEGRRYADKTPADGHFTLEVSEDPDTYVPNTAYTVTLKGQSSPMLHRFTGFLLVAESDTGQGAVGSFQMTGLLTKYSDKCPNAITNANYQQKSEIQSVWTAPPPDSGCITLKATVVEHHEIWHMDDASLTKRLCERDEGGADMDAAIVDPCCACDEAKYEVTFEGLWSRHTHPRGFPPNKWMTRFSDVIGASHAADYRFWVYGTRASEGLRQLAEHGATKVLESELKAQSDHIRTIIKARGISFPNLTGKTFAVFRVDNRHHLMSLVSMIDPSPDWIVGVSGLELCLPNCTWVESRVINLFPWDAGTDSGPTYISADQPTIPRDVIRKIGPSFPNDQRSPFYDPSGKEMKPLARLYLSRQRLYEKSCEANGEDDLNGMTDPCAVTSWNAWSTCSATCGKGVRHRQRNYRNPGSGDNSRCEVELTERETCTGPRQHCGVPSEYEPDPAQSEGLCGLSHWTQWSGCSERCGWGNKVRTRKFKHKGGYKRCHQGESNKPVLQQTIPCLGTDEDCPEYDVLSDGENQYENPNCPVSEWSDWSPCDAQCGEGKMTRTRYRLEPHSQYSKKRVSFKEPVHQNLGVIGLHETDDTNNDEEEEDNGAEEEDGDDPCIDTMMEEETKCNGTAPNCFVSEKDAREICSLPKKVGPCRGYMERWFFDINGKTCEPFGFTGCQGNKNNFRTNQECWRVCGSYKEDLLRIERILDEGETNEDENYLISAAKNQTVYDITMQNDGTINFYDRDNYPSSGSQKKCRPPLSGEIVGPGQTGDGTLTGIDRYPICDSTGDLKIVSQHIVGKVVNCKMSRWTAWSACYPPCGKGWREKTREILRHPMNGGRRCTELKKVMQCKKNKPCRDNNADDEDGEEVDNDGRDPTSPTWGPGNVLPNTKIDCQLSEWSPWSPCAVTCGIKAIQQRTRTVIQAPSNDGEPCQVRLEKKYCDFLPCSQY